MSSLIKNVGLKPATSRLTPGIVLTLLILPILIYLPGLNGPFVFDDVPNIVANNNIHMKQFSLGSLNVAAHSLHSGPLGRPLAGISFAINYYLAGGLTSTFSYKVFNMAIHIANGLLIFWLVSLITMHLPGVRLFSDNTPRHKKDIQIFAGICAIFWVIHPIQLTSVLYVVQRMTSMAALFILLSIIAYIYARNSFNKKEKFKALVYFFASILFGITSAACKETALLLPLYLGLIEFSVFYDHYPWPRWRLQTKRKQILLASSFIIVLVILIIIAINFAIPGYANREFTMTERIITEPRVILFYLNEILIPRLSTFGIYHDDIKLSTSLLSPWTTLPSIVLLLCILVFAFRYRRRYALVSFGILWFFTSHALESTFFPLQLAHEHRNYLASLGPLLIVANGLTSLMGRIQNRKIWLLIPLLMIGLVITTTVRSMQWAELMKIDEAQAIHHPESSQAWANLSISKARENRPNIALASIQKAIQLKPDEPGYYLFLYLFSKSFAPSLVPMANQGILRHIKDSPDSNVLSNTIHRISQCLDTNCKDLQHDFDQWLVEAMKYSRSPRYSYYYGCSLYAQGNFESALRYLDQSIKDSQKRYPDPLIKRIKVLLSIKQYVGAKAAYTELQKLNEKRLFVSASEMANIQKLIKSSE